MHCLLSPVVVVFLPTWVCRSRYPAPGAAAAGVHVLSQDKAKREQRRRSLTSAIANVSCLHPPSTCKPSHSILTDDPFTRTMVVCRFFLNGYCRYGDSCYNEHTSRGPGNVFSQSGGSGGGGGGQRRPLVQPSRFGNSGGAVDATGTGFSFTRALADPSVGQSSAKSVRFSETSSPSSNSFFSNQSANPFANTQHQQQPTTGFSFTQTLNQMNQASVFGGSASPSGSSFGQASPFGQPLQQQSVFGQAQQQAQQFPAFGQQQMQQPVQQSTFGQTSPFSQQAFPAFGQPATFSQPLGGFGQPPAFGAPAFGQVSAFGQAGVFGQQQQQQSLMQQPVPAFGQSPFGVIQGQEQAPPPPPTQRQVQISMCDQVVSPFGQATMQQAKPSASDLFSQSRSYANTGFGGGNSGSVFGNAAMPVSNPAEAEPQAFSTMEELSEDDIAAFRASEFQFGKVPLLPPPIQLCS